MSLIRTLARVALGVIAYKGITNAMNPNTRGGAPGNEGGLGGMLDRMARPREGSMLDRVIDGLGQPQGQSPSQAPSQGGFADRRPGRGVPYGGEQSRTGSGLDNLLGGLGGALGGIVGAAAGRAPADAAPDSPWSAPAGGDRTGGGFADKLRQAEAGQDPAAPSAGEEAVAALLLRAMIQAAKSDGEIDAEERQIILGNLKNASEAEVAFVRQEMDGPVDAKALAAATPDGLEREVYGASLLAINADHFAEHDHLRRLAEALGLTEAEVAELNALAPKRAPAPGQGLAL